MPLPQPRDRLDAAFRDVVDEIYAILTSRMTQSIGAQARIHGGLAQSLPQVSTSRIGGFAETLASPAYGGHAELADIAHAMALEVNELFPIAEALHISSRTVKEHIKHLCPKLGAVTRTQAVMIAVRDKLIQP